ncbi:hypothetical protein KGF54_000019 [Candida jiufengensis]|uniref:uncharacterized protein n=1 Tax=Candida jiufengensis TaxID=497108 RepID=UPI00222580D5|nr:uncharacterized protein KGF54_000019 [Candida jiufengensis]KAI5957091.1 hypothetical protein KGF54_000019 [Candida jiufengensis]
MGKLKKGRKNTKNRLNPIASKSQQEVKKDETTRQSKILPLINKLKSTIPNDKSMALGAITVLAEDFRMRQLLLKDKIVQVVMETCLNDSNDEIVVEAFGLLRNLGIESGYDVIKFLWRQGIWTSIENALNKIDVSFKLLAEKGNVEKDKSKIQLLYDFAENILSLIITLASGDEEIYESIFNKIDPIIDLVFKLLKNHINGSFKVSKLFDALLDFIYEFSTESVEFVEKCKNFDSWDKLISYIGDSNSKLSKVYIEGIKYNNYEVLEASFENKQEVMCNILHQIYSILISIDLQQLKSRINSIQNPNNANEPIKKDSNTIETDLSANNDVKRETKIDLSTIETGLTIITSVLEYLAVNEEDPNEPITLSPETENILFQEIEPMLLEILQFELSEKILSLSESILGAINNFCWLILSNEHLPVSWYDKSLQLWDLILTINDEQLQKSSLSILWAILKSLGPEISEKIPIELIEKLLTVQLAEDNLNVIGVLGSIAPIIKNKEITFKISQFLLDSVNTACENIKSVTNLEIIIESLNMIYDIFGDKEFDYDYEIFVQNDYLTILKNLEPKLKEIYKKIDKNKEPQLKLKMEETRINLERFIQYKASER